MVIVWEQKVSIESLEKNQWRPIIYLSCAISLDGKLVSSAGDSRLSSFEDKVAVHKLRSTMDGILVGVNTILKDNPHLTVSEKYYKSQKHPIRIVLDSNARTPPNSEILTRKPEVPTIIFVSKEASTDNVKSLREKGALIEFVDRSHEGLLDLSEVLKILKSKYKIEKLMVEGGGRVLGSFIKNSYFDYLRLSINPVFFGSGISLIEGVSFKTVEESPKLKLVKVEKLGWSVVLHYVRE